MRKILSGVIAASFVATVGLSAQEPPSSSPGAQAPAGGQGRTVTLSGCIQNAPSASASAAGASATASASSKFVLATKPAAGAPGAAVGTSGTAMRYQLDGDEKAISPHLNHQVEITGTVQSGAAGAGAAAAAGAAGAAGGAAAPTLKVDSVKMVAATCS